MVLLLSSLFFLLCSIAQGHPARLSIWVPGSPEQILAENTGQHENIPVNLEDVRRGSPSIQEDEAGRSTLVRPDTDAASEPDESDRRRQKRSLTEEIQDLARKYRNMKVKQCCHDGHQHYKAEGDCWMKLKEKVTDRCSAAFEECCFHSQDHFTKSLTIYYDFMAKPMIRAPVLQVAEEARIIDLSAYDGQAGDIEKASRERGA